MSYAVGPSEPALRDLTLGALLTAAADSAPDRVALIAGVPDPAQRREWTYSAVHAASVRAAHALLQRFEPGERVAVWAPNIPQWIMLEFGAAMAGLVLVTVNPAFRAREVEYVLTQSKAAGVVVCTAFKGNSMLATIEEVRPRCPALREVICFDAWDAFLDSGDDSSRPLPPVQPNDAVMIQYTSGTTGFPKGALLHHRGLVNNASHTLDRIGAGEESVTITMMPRSTPAGARCASWVRSRSVRHRCWWKRSTRRWCSN